MNNKVKGYILGTVAAATYGMNPLFALPLYAGGMDADSVLFFRYLFAIPILGAMIKMRGRSFAIQPRPALALVAMGIMMAFSSLFLFQSYNYMDAGIASSLLFVYPVMVAVMMTCVFHERLTIITILCMALALGGIGLLYNGENGVTLSLTGTIMVFLSALTYAVYIVFINRSRLNSLPTVKVTFYVLLFGWVVFAIRLIASGTIALPAQWYLWGNLVALAIFPTAISLLCTTRAIQYIGSPSHTRGARACYGCNHRYHGVRRKAHTTLRNRYRTDNSSSHPGRGRRFRGQTSHAAPQTLPPHQTPEALTGGRLRPSHANTLG